MPIPPEYTTKKSRVYFAAIEALKALNALSRESAQKGSEVLKKAREMYPELNTAPKPVTDDNFWYYLSDAVANPASPVNCEGPWRGYYYSEAAKDLAGAVLTEGAPPAEEIETKRREKEKQLYPIVIQWLQSQGFRCEDTSSLRTLGKWGNPDVTGLQVTESYGAIDVEICTIEVKCTYENWEYYIFEAIAHRRWANRSYFAFAVPEEILLKLPRDLRYYSELYQIGILAVLLETTTYNSLQSGHIDTPVTADKAIVQELYSAPYQTTQPLYKKRFLEEGLRLQEINKVCAWGEAIEDED